MRIHREGFRILIWTGLALILACYGCWALSPALGALAGLLAAGLYLFLINFFRDPHRDLPPPDVRIVYAPADGKVVVVEKMVEELFLKDKRLQVSIFMSPLNVHVNRSPVAGEVLWMEYSPGAHLPAWEPKSSVVNERSSVAVQAGPHRVLFRQIAGAMARRVVCYVKQGQVLRQGEEIGFIKFGSRMDLFLPPDSEILVTPGQMVKAGITPLARLPE